MSIAQRIVNFSDGLSADGVLSAAKGGTGNTTGTASGGASSTPTISAIGYGGDDTATNPAGGATITLTGTNFASGAKVLINTTPVSVVTVVSATQITFTAPALAAGSYILYVVNLDGSTAIAVPGIQYSGTPAWTTAAGTLGTSYETAPVSTAVAATSDSTVTYSVVSGTLPSGVTINASGTISGTSPAVGGSTTYTFTVRATDLELQDTDRQFSLTINPDVVTWSSANAFALEQNAASTTTLSATSAAGQTVSYSVDTLPAGLTLSGATVSGTATTAGTTTTTATATAAVTGKTAQQTITWTVSIAADAYFNYTTLLLNAETVTSTFLADASTNNFQLSASGDTKPSNFGPYTPGYYSVALDSQRHLSTPANTAFDFGSGDFTVEAWVYFKTYNSMQYSGHTIATNYENNNGWNFGFGGQNGIDGLGISTYSGNNLATSVSATGVNSSVVPLNKWHHVAVTKSGSTVRIFVNGVGYTTSGTYTAVGAGGRFAIGVYQQNMTYSGNPNWNISNLRVVKGTAVYTTDFTPSIIPLTAVTGTSLLACQGNRFVDASANAFVLTASSSSNISVSSFVPFQPSSSYSTYGSTYFDGTGDYLTVSNSNLALGNGDFTLECWINASSGLSDKSIFEGRSVGSGSTGFTLTAITATSIRIYSGNSALITSGSINYVNTWCHVAVVRASGTTTLYINGVSQGTTTSLGNLTDSSYVIGAGKYATPPSVDAFFTGYISNFRIVKGTALYTASFTPPTEPLTAVANTQLLTLQTNQPHTNSQFLDNSTSALTITRSGNATQGSFSPYGANWSAYFDGSGDYLSTSYNSAFVFTGDFTVEFWVNFSAHGSYGGMVSCAGSSNGWGGWNIIFNNTTDNILVEFNNVAVSIVSSSALVKNAWSHVALVRSGTSVVLYINGVSNGTATYGSTIDSSSAPLMIGVERTSLYYITGYISNVRVVKGTAVYTSNFTPPTSPLTPIAGTTLLTCQAPLLVDSSLNGFAITRNGDVSVQRFSPFATVTQTPQTHSVYFDGSGDYLTIPDNNPILRLSNNSFTIEAWIYLTNTSTGTLVSQWQSGGGYAFLVYVTGNGNMTFYWNNAGSYTTTSSPFTTNQWMHVAIVKNGTASNNGAIYVNGVLKDALFTIPSINGSTAAVSIGYNLDGANSFTGSISNFRIVNGTAVYTTNFTPPTTPLTAITNTSLLTCQSATIVDNSTNAFTITANGNTVPRRQNPFGFTTSAAQDYTTSVFGSSAYFDGSDYLEFPLTNNTFKFGTGEFTVEFWVYPTSAPNNDWTPFFTIGGSGGGQEIRISQNINMGSGYGYLIPNSANNADIYPSFGNFNLFEWHHLALVRSGTTVSFYRNGNLVGTTTSATFNFTNTSVGRIAYPQPAYPDGSYIGYMSDVRIANKALYTANFVPPSAPLQAVSGTVLLLNMDKSAINDKSGKVVAETVGDTRLSTSVKKYGTSSLYFDGTGDYLTFPSNPQYAFGTGDFTAECWVYPSSSVTADQGLLYLGGNSTYAAVRLGIATNGVYLLCSSAGNSWAVQTGVVGTITLNTWTHIAVTRSGSSFRLFVNGTQVGTTQTSSASLMSGFNYVGTYQNTSFFNFTGYMDDVRVTTGYARYTANFTPPTQALLTK